jgi:hypothetical protein
MVLLGAGDSIVTAETGTPFSRLTILNAYSSNFVKSANQSTRPVGGRGGLRRSVDGREPIVSTADRGSRQSAAGCDQRRHRARSVLGSSDAGEISSRA